MVFISNKGSECMTRRTLVAEIWLKEDGKLMVVGGSQTQEGEEWCVRTYGDGSIEDTLRGIEAYLTWIKKQEVKK